MQKPQKAMATLAAVIGMGILSTAPVKADMVVKAHQNDCKTAAHACAGKASKSLDKSDFLMVPTGLCNKIAGGSTKGA